MMIYSTVRSNRDGILGHVDCDRRLDVAVARARHGFIMVGNSRTLMNAFQSSSQSLVFVFFGTVSC